MYYELLKYEEAVNTKRYQQQLTDLIYSLLEKRPERSTFYHSFEFDVFFYFNNSHFVLLYLVKSIPEHFPGKINDF